MNDRACCAIAELLVDYADGELAGPQRRRVEDHLAACPGCRAELKLLERSLELVQAVWREAAAAEPAPVGPSRAASPARGAGSSGRWAAGVCAASLVLLLLAASVAWFARRPASTDQPAVAVNGGEARVPSAPSQEEIDQFISRETRSARLAAAVQLLATQPGLDDYKAEAQHYLAEVASGPGWTPQPEPFP